MSQLLIGIDLGSSGIRIEVYDIEGKILDIGKASIARQSIDEWLKALREAVPSIIKSCSDCEKHVSVTSTSGTLIGVNRYGEVVYGPLMYYERDDEIYEKIKSCRSTAILSKKGVKIDSTSPIVKIYRLKNDKLELYEKIRWFISPTTYILYTLLYGTDTPWDEVYTDYTNALKFGLDITSAPPTWFREIYEELGLDIDKLPRLAPVGEFIGIAKSRFAEEVGLKGAKLYQGLTDGNAAAIAGGAVDVGDVSIYTGSTTVPKVVVSEIIEHPALYYHIHPIEGYLAGSASGFTGAFLSWFAEKVLGVSLDSVAKYLEEVKAGTEYLFFPYGDRAPFYDSLLTPAFLNLRVDDEAREIIVSKLIRSIMLGITLLENYYVSLFEELFKLRTSCVHVTGGATKSKTWNRIRASVYEKRVAIYGDLIGSGIIVPFLIRNKFYTSVEEVRNRFIKPIDIIEPEVNMIEVYRKYKEAFIKRWTVLQQLYRL